MSEATEQPGHGEDSSSSAVPGGEQTGDSSPESGSQSGSQTESPADAPADLQSAPRADAVSSDSSSSAELSHSGGGGASQRRSSMESAMAALKYVGKASSTDQVQVRTSDRLTVVALLVCCIVEVLSLVYSPLVGYRLYFIGFSDIVLSIAVICFLVVRLGILSTLSERQVIICWQLMMGCVFLGIFLCVNVACGVAFLVSSLNPM